MSLKFCTVLVTLLKWSNLLSESLGMKETRTVYKIRRCNSAVEIARRLNDQELWCDFSKGKEIFPSQNFQTVCATPPLLILNGHCSLLYSLFRAS